jgi:hypothetical protein
MTTFKDYIPFEFPHTGENWNCSTAETFISLESAAYKKHWAHKHCHNTL